MLLPHRSYRANIFVVQMWCFYIDWRALLSFLTDVFFFSSLALLSFLLLFFFFSFLLFLFLASFSFPFFLSFHQCGRKNFARGCQQWRFYAVHWHDVQAPLA